MGLFSLLMQNPLTFLMLAIVLLYSIIFHEIAHGLVASWFGDNTAKRSGRLTLSPIAHIDPIGTLMLLLIGFGWAKPVPVNFANLRPSRLGVICVALAGCTINIIIAMAALLLIRLNIFSPSSLFATVLPIVAKINIILAAFNLIPIPPLDGSRVVMEFLPRQMQASLTRIEPYGFLIIIILLYTGVLHPVIDLLQNLIYSFISIFFV